MLVRSVFRWSIVAAVAGVGACRITLGPDQGSTTRLIAYPDTVRVSVGDSVQIATYRMTRTELVAVARSVKWTSNSPNIAAASSSGMIHGRAPGTAVVEASTDGVTNRVGIRVLSTCAPSISAIPALLSLKVGQSNRLRALASACAPPPSNRIEWTHIDSTVATVSDSGVVSAHGAGTTLIFLFRGDVPFPLSAIAVISVTS